MEVFSFDWQSDPRKPQEWYDEQVEQFKYAPEIVRREIDISYDASIANIFINPDHIRAAVGLELPNSTGAVSAGLDIASGGINNSALTIKTGNTVEVEEWNFDNGIDVAAKAVDKCSKAGADYMNYDRIGVGFAVYSYLERTEQNLPFSANGVDAGGRASDEYYPEFKKYGHQIFYNAKAEWWYVASKMFERTYEHVNGVKHDPETLISLPNNQNLVAQLCAPKRKMTAKGRIQVESKEELKSRGIESPDLADSFIMAVIPKNANIRRVIQSNIDGYDFDIDFNDLSDYTTIYVSVWAEKNMKTSVVCFTWNAEQKRLCAFLEHEFSSHSPKTIIGTIMLRLKDMGFTGQKKLNWYGNSLFFSPDFKLSGLDFAFIKEGVYLSDNPDYDEYGAVDMMNVLQRKGWFLLSNECPILKSQMSEWSIQSDKPDDGYAFARASCNIVSVLKESGKIEKAIRKHRPYSKGKDPTNNSAVPTGEHLYSWMAN